MLISAEEPFDCHSRFDKQHNSGSVIKLMTENWDFVQIHTTENETDLSSLNSSWSNGGTKVF